MQRVVVTPFIYQFQLYLLVWLIEALDCSTSTYNVFLDEDRNKVSNLV